MLQQPTILKLWLQMPNCFIATGDKAVETVLVDLGKIWILNYISATQELNIQFQKYRSFFVVS